MIDRYNVLVRSTFLTIEPYVFRWLVGNSLYELKTSMIKMLLIFLEVVLAIFWVHGLVWLDSMKHFAKLQTIKVF